MSDLYIVGAGGFGAEVEWLVDQLNASEKYSQYNVVAFVNQLLDELKYPPNKRHCGLPVISGIELAERTENSAFSVAIAIGDVKGRRQAFDKLPESNIDFPVLFHPSVEYDDREGRITFGEGTIVCAGSILTTKIEVGKFVHINLDCTIGHDVEIGDFCTFSPGVHISGKVKIGYGVFFGTGVVVLPGIEIGDGAIVGAGAMVRENVAPNTIVVGVPAKPRHKKGV